MIGVINIILGMLFTIISPFTSVTKYQLISVYTCLLAVLIRSITVHLFFSPSPAEQYQQVFNSIIECLSTVEQLLYFFYNKKDFYSFF